MPITREHLLQFKELKIAAKQEFEAKKNKELQELERKVEDYKNQLLREFGSVLKEGERLDAEINYLDELIREEEKGQNELDIHGEVI